MKKFKFQGNNYECDDKYTHVAADKNGEVYAYEKEPTFFKPDGYWDYHHMDELEPLQLLPIDVPNWETSLVEI